MSKNVFYIKSYGLWRVKKGTTGIAWKDAPLKKRVSINVVTSMDNDFYDHEVLESTSITLTVMKRDSDGNLWFLNVPKF